MPEMTLGKYAVVPSAISNVMPLAPCSAIGTANVTDGESPVTESVAPFVNVRALLPVKDTAPVPSIDRPPKIKPAELVENTAPAGQFVIIAKSPGQYPFADIQLAGSDKSPPDAEPFHVMMLARDGDSLPVPVK